MTHPFSLNGRRALVTGATRGLGFEIAGALADAGAHVLVNGREEESCARAVAALSGRGSVEALAFDVADEAAVSQAFHQLSTDGLDVLVNNVGLRDRRPLEEHALEDVRRMLEVNLVAPFNLSRQAAGIMRGRGFGRIINLTSLAGPLSNRGDISYTIAKGGLETLTKSFAAELGGDGITVNAIAPGYFATEQNAEMVAKPGVAEWLRRRTSIGRWGEPKEIAGAAVFLASDTASYVTGHVLFVDGGYMSHF